MNTKTIKALLIDDEITSLQNLKQKIEEFCRQVRVLAAIPKTEDMIRLIKELKPDVLFLEMQTPDVRLFNLLDALNDDIEIVFTTYENHNSVNAFRFSGFQYLVKPVAIDDLENVVNRVTANGPKHTRRRLQVLRSVYGTPIDPGHSMVIWEKGDLIFVPINQIARIESDSENSRLFLSTGRSFLSTILLNDYEEMLKPYHFFRVKNNQLVNLALIQKFQKVTGSEILLKNGDIVDIDRRKQNDFLKVFRERRTVGLARDARSVDSKRNQK